MRIAQEFYCTKTGGGCGGYFTANLNMHLNVVVTVVCPNCKHEHQRYIKNGVLIEDGRTTGKPVEEILGNPASFSKKPKSKLWTRMKQSFSDKERDAVVLNEGQEFLADRWFEIHGGKQ